MAELLYQIAHMYLNKGSSVSSRFEKMAESCKKSLEVLKLAQSRGLPPPKHHFEEKSFHTVRWAH